MLLARAPLVFLLLTSCGNPTSSSHPPKHVEKHVWHILPDRTGDAPTIQAGIDSAKAGDVVLLGAGTYTWRSQAPASHSMASVKTSITIRGEAGAEKTVIDGQDQGRLIYCENAGAVRIEGIALQRGLTRASTSPSSPFIYEYGGAIYSDEGSNLMMASCIISGNRGLAGSKGAGVFCFNGTIVESQIVDNIAGPDSYGIGIWCAGQLTISRSTIRNHHGWGDPGPSGAGMVVASGIVEDCWIEGNSVSGHEGAAGGGIAIRNGTVTRCVFIRNSATVTVDLSFSSAYGGAVVCVGACMFSQCVFADNVAVGGNAAGAGGAIGSVSYEPVTVENCTFVGNRASGGESDPLHTRPISCVGVAKGSVRASLLAWNDGCPVNGTVTTACCDFWGNTPVDTLRGVAQEGDFSVDPLFCSDDPLGTRNFVLQIDSPCAPGRHPNGVQCGTIGAGAVGCQSVAVSIDDVPAVPPDRD